jgi:hypothetical protein
MGRKKFCKPIPRKKGEKRDWKAELDRIASVMAPVDELRDVLAEEAKMMVKESTYDKD